MATKNSVAYPPGFSGSVPVALRHPSVPIAATAGVSPYVSTTSPSHPKAFGIPPTNPATGTTNSSTAPQTAAAPGGGTSVPIAPMSYPVAYYPPPPGFAPHPAAMAPYGGYPMFAGAPYPHQYPMVFAAPHPQAPPHAAYGYPYPAAHYYGAPQMGAPWPYGAYPPGMMMMAPTAGPFAGAAVQTSSVAAPAPAAAPCNAHSPTGGNDSSASGTTTSPTESRQQQHSSSTNHRTGTSSFQGNSGSGSGSDSNNDQSTHATPPSSYSYGGHAASRGNFNVASSNRAIIENRQLIVKFLTDDTTEAQFRELFERHGAVDNARIIFDKKTNHTKGFGFITYVRPEDAVKALRTMGGYQLHGRQLNVALAQTERKRAFGSGLTVGANISFGGGGGGAESGSANDGATTPTGDSADSGDSSGTTPCSTA